MDAPSILAGLRAGRAPEAAALEWMAAGLADGSVSDAQAGAFAMGLCHVPLDAASRAALTLAMRDSGEVLRWDLPGPVLDKHSTGGVGDCVSLVLAPALAACGAFVPMISGRGLGHTGGTLDKLEAIPGFDVEADAQRLDAIVRETGCAIVSASAGIAPADRRLYAIRDVTGTVDSLDLITASILSKKLAAGLEGLVLDVKTGSGAFMKDKAAAEALGEALVSTANAAGCPTTALVTDMSEPLAPAAGNAVEVAEAMAVLSGTGDRRLKELTVALGAALLASGGLAASVEDGAASLRSAIDGGQAMERMSRMVRAQGGPGDFAERWAEILPQSSVTLEVSAEEAGVITAIDGRALGRAVIGLGGGRLRDGDRIDHSVGFTALARIGDAAGPGHLLGRIHARSPEQADRAAAELRALVTIGEGATPGPLILTRIGGRT
ncbi:thymidine phosphorylase [Tropicimonas sp. IMCC34011]|uniref:thymidine phosphorylase n=1 Tax=Tropicimonas sp. IMCC34011 TaxID=2248759 RepID=UPI000E24E119|nr:thymidine phosphorylase [Tropicimonas sp. IMCC34011]